MGSDSSLPPRQRRHRRRAPSITVSGATETPGERVKTSVNENDDEDNDGHRLAVRAVMYDRKYTNCRARRRRRRRRPSKSCLYLEQYAPFALYIRRAIYFSITTKICVGNKVATILRHVSCAKCVDSLSKIKCRSATLPSYLKSSKGAIAATAFNYFYDAVVIGNR